MRRIEIRAFVLSLIIPCLENSSHLPASLRLRWRYTMAGFILNPASSGDGHSMVVNLLIVT